MTTHDALLSKRYHIGDEIGSGGMGTVHRAWDRLMRRLVALKRVSVSGKRKDTLPSVDDIDLRTALANEFRLLASLRHPNVISVLDYGFDAQGQPYFTMELLEDARTIIDVARQRELDAQVRLLAQVLEALTYLHRHGLIHRDLKPDNVLVLPDDTVKVLDFGLAIMAERAVKEKQEAVASGDAEGQQGDRASGTLAYMAPEVLSHNRMSHAADLYAVGIIAYEMLAGRHPFRVDSIMAMVEDLINKVPDLNALPQNPSLASVIGRLLVKNPQDRYQDSLLVLRDLAEAVDQPQLAQRGETRESLLQGAAFVGRESELSALNEALGVCGEQRGSLWLIGGESGVGKSRLMEELRTRALVQGFFVVSGQGIGEGASPYALWRGVLRWLALNAPINDLQAGVLKPIITDIDDLLERPIPDAPQLSQPALHMRMLSTLEDLFDLYVQHVGTPLLILLDDLHWAGSESLTVLRQLSRRLADMPILIVASYRSDEAPLLPDKFTAARTLRLQRLTGQEIALLSRSMLGAVGERASVVDLLTRESDGNLFFIIEAVRTLAEDAGDLSLVGMKTLPQHVFEGGLRTIAQRRLSHLPAEARELLRLAAVMGRQLDLKMLEAAGRAHLERGGFTLEAWLTLCSDEAVLDVMEDTWRFLHDKLREGLLEELDPLARRDLHRQVAETMEALHRQQQAYTVSLAYHWREAGQPDKEAFYSALAGEQALQNGAYQEAVRFLTRALDRHAQHAQDDATLARLERLLGAAYLALNDFPQSLHHTKRAVALYNLPLAEESRLFVRQLAGQALQQLGHLLLPRFFVEKHPERDAYYLDATLAHEQLTEIGYYTNDSLLGVYAALRSLNLAEQTSPSAQLARAYGSMSYIALLLRPALARRYNRRIEATVNRTDEEYGKVRAYQLSTLWMIGTGEFDRALERLEEVIQRYEALGEKRFWAASMQTMGEVLYLMGEFEHGREIRERTYEQSLRTGNVQGQAFGMRGRALSALLTGRNEDALTAAEGAMALFTACSDQVGAIDSWALAALAHWRLGDAPKAQQKAAFAFHLIGDRAPSSYNAIVGYTALAELAVERYQPADSEAEPNQGELKSQMEQALAALKRYQGRFMIGAPRYLLYRGRYYAALDQLQRARQDWHQALKLAERYQMRYDALLAAAYLARQQAPDTKDNALRELARQLDDLGAHADAHRLRHSATR